MINESKKKDMYNFDILKNTKNIFYRINIYTNDTIVAKHMILDICTQEI